MFTGLVPDWLEHVVRVFGFKFLPACAILAGVSIAYATKTKANWIFRYSLQKEWTAGGSDKVWARHCYATALWFVSCGTVVMILFWDFV
jgi:hypothetical protein